MVPNIKNSQTTIFDKAIISGHYVFSSNQFKDLNLKQKIFAKKVNLDNELKNKLKSLF